MKPARRVFVVGGSHTTYMGRGRPEYVSFRKAAATGQGNPTLQDHMGRAVQRLFEQTGVDPACVDKGWVSNFLGECFVRQAHLGAMLAAVEPALEGKPLARVEAACASGGVAIGSCIDAMQAGCDVTLAVGVEVETNVRGSEGVDHMALAAHQASQRQLSQFVFPHLFARRAKAWKEAYGGTSTDLARLAAKAHANANLNPEALHWQTRLSLEQADRVDEHNRCFLEDPELFPHMRLSDCTAFTDGASAVLLATEEPASIAWAWRWRTPPRSCRSATRCVPWAQRPTRRSCTTSPMPRPSRTAMPVCVQNRWAWPRCTTASRSPRPSTTPPWASARPPTRRPSSATGPPAWTAPSR